MVGKIWGTDIMIRLHRRHAFSEYGLRCGCGSTAITRFANTALHRAERTLLRFLMASHKTIKIYQGVESSLYYKYSYCI